MTPDHIIFIPMVLMVGGFLGFVVGARAARNRYDLERRRDEERQAARAAREAKRSARVAAGGKVGDGADAVEAHGPAEKD